MRRERQRTRPVLLLLIKPQSSLNTSELYADKQTPTQATVASRLLGGDRPRTRQLGDSRGRLVYLSLWLCCALLPPNRDTTRSSPTCSLPSVFT